MLRQSLHIFIVSYDVTVRFESLWALVWRCKMILTLQTLVAFHRILQLKLNLRIIGRKLEADLVNKLRSQSEMCPSL